MGAKAETGANANRQQKRDHGAIVNRIKVAEKSQNFLTSYFRTGAPGVESPWIYLKATPASACACSARARRCRAPRCRVRTIGDAPLQPSRASCHAAAGSRSLATQPAGKGRAAVGG